MIIQQIRNATVKIQYIIAERCFVNRQHFSNEINHILIRLMLMIPAKEFPNVIPVFSCLFRRYLKEINHKSFYIRIKFFLPIPFFGYILDEDRKRNAELFEEAFYGKKNLNPQMIDAGSEKIMTVPDGVDAEALAKVLANPEMVALLTSLAKTIGKK